MHIILLYGPPAAGKLTVAKSLSRAIGYPVLHNQVTFDVVRTFFEVEDKPFWNINKNMRKLLINAAIKEKKKGMIMTIVYSGKKENTFAYLFDLARKRKIKLSCVRLSASKETLMRRIKHKSRRKHKKIVSKQKMMEYFAKYDPEAQIPNRKNIVIDTEKLKPAEASKKILRALKL